MAYNQQGHLDLKTFIHNYYTIRLNFVADNEALIRILIRESTYDPGIIVHYQNTLPNNF